VRLAIEAAIALLAVFLMIRFGQPSPEGASLTTSIAFPVFKRALTSKSFVVSGQMQSAVLHQAVIAGMLPLRDANNRFEGVISVALQLHWLDFMVRAHGLPKGAVVFIYDHDGNLLATSNAPVARTLVGTAKRFENVGDVHSAHDADGNSWTFATSPLRGSAINVAFAMRESNLFSDTYLHVGADFLMPIFMIGLAWAGIWFATERQVTQWIAYLRRIAIAYRSGHYTIRPDLADAPSEFKQLGEAMSAMAEGIQDRDRRLRDSVNMKTVLIREIHHRVKNNLQIVMSLLSLQANQVKDPTARDALMQAQTRINALALVHRILNELEDQSTLDLKQLLDELSRQIAEGIGNTKNVRVDVDVPPMVVSSNVAVAMALFTVEALTNIFKHAFPRQAPGVIRVKLAPDGEGRLKLSVADDGIGFSLDETGRSVGSRLIRTFGAQLGGVSSVHSRPGEGTVVELVFPDPTLKERGEAPRMPQKAEAAAGE